MLDNQIIVDFQAKILDWYAIHARDLPWRKTTNPYKIRISESMLAQTQVNRVIGYYEKWLELFPSVDVLAKASNEDVLRAWSGLGYNSRALRLKQAAQEIQNSKLRIQSNIDRRDALLASPKLLAFSRGKHGLFNESDYFPNTYEDLIALPGVGNYIANAVLAFAFNEDVVVIDTNIRRIMIHFFGKAGFGLDAGVKTGSKQEAEWLKAIVWQTLPKGQARTWYNALMDYGAFELTSLKTGIKPTTKQSKFHGSTRQVRAGIVRVILNSECGMLNYSDIEKLFPERDDLDQIIDKMIKNNLIVRNNQILSIK